LLAKNIEIAPGATLECFLVSYITIQPSLELVFVVCDFEILSIGVASSIEVVKTSRCSNSTCLFITLVPKRVLYAIC